MNKCDNKINKTFSPTEQSEPHILFLKGNLTETNRFTGFSE